MNLSLTLSAGRFHLLRNDAGLLFWNDPTIAYLCHELSIGVTANQLALEKLMVKLSVLKIPVLAALFESLRRELTSIGSLVGFIARDFKSLNYERMEANFRDVEKHLNHYEIKSQYVESHLKEYFSAEELESAGTDFKDESSSIVQRIHLMDAGW